MNNINEGNTEVISLANDSKKTLYDVEVSDKCNYDYFQQQAMYIYIYIYI
jgi:hypothetical protein